MFSFPIVRNDPQCKQANGAERDQQGQEHEIEPGKPGGKAQAPEKDHQGGCEAAHRRHRGCADAPCEKFARLHRNVIIEPVVATDSSPVSRPKKERSGGLGIGILSRRSGCNIETIRYYERISLMPEPPRTPGGHRSYSNLHERRLVFIRRCRELGFSVEEIRVLLGLVDGGGYTCGEVKAVTDRHLDDVRRKVADLRKLERTLKKMSAACAGGQVPECPIIDTLYGAAGKSGR